jgi:DNA primase
VVTAATVEPAPVPVNPPTPSPVPVSTNPRPQVDFAFIRRQIGMEQVLRHFGLFDQMRGSGQQRRGPCPLHARTADIASKTHTFSVNLAKNVCQCFQAKCAVQGNVLDLWAAVHRLPLYEAALLLAETFHLQKNREEEPVNGTR